MKTKGERVTVETSRAVFDVMAKSPTSTVMDIAAAMKVTVNYVSRNLGLHKLNLHLLGLVTNGQINIGNAYALARVPPEFQDNYREKATTLAPQEFVPYINSEVKRLKPKKERYAEQA